MNKLRVFALSFTLLLGAAPVLAAPTRFLSPNFAVESVIFGGTGVLRSSEASIPPVITLSPVVSNILTTSVTVSWSTDKPSSSVVELGTVSGTYPIQAGDVINTTFTAHSVNITNLVRGTLYFYKVRSVDVAGNITESAELQFTTDPGDITAPIVTSGPSIVKTSATAIIVTWETNELANTIVEYGIKAVDENAIGHSEELTTFHQVQISALASSQKYLIRIKSRDASGNLYTGPTQELVTLNAPNITDVKISDITLDSAIISWQTSSPSNSTVNYGTSSTYDQSVKDLATFAQSHLVRLSGLQNGTVYHFRIIGDDQSGNRITSDEYTFKTVILPIISNFKVSGIGADTALVTWDSSSDIDELIKYTITKTDKPKLQGKQLTAGNDKLVSKHSYQLPDLESGTGYKVSVIGKDVFGNQAVSQSLDFTTAPDTDTPLIQNIKSDTSVDLGSKKSVQVLVSFGTGEPTIATIEYASGSNGAYDHTINMDTDFTQNKFMVIPGLEPGQTYHYRIVVKDPQGNQAVSADYLVLAPSQSVSLLDLIANQISQNFSWLTHIGQ